MEVHLAVYRSPESILKLFESKKVVDLQEIQAALNDASSVTAFRYLKHVPYRRSYNYNGRYYTSHELSRYDRLGLWSYGDIHFSLDGSLRNTVRRLVQESKNGSTHQELYARLRVRVQNTLYDLFNNGEIARTRVVSVYIYLHTDPSVRKMQLQRRRDQIASEEAAAAKGVVSEHIVIKILLTLIHHPEAKAADVLRYLHGHSPPISMEQVNTVFTRYDLEKIGEKGGASTS